MNPFDSIIKKIKYRHLQVPANPPAYEFCPKCDANLTLQKGYSNDLPFWNCRGCGEMLINPAVDAEDDIAWICDGCGAMLNVQEGFAEHGGEWKCEECGFINKIDPSEMYLSEDEYQTSLKDPYKGMSDEAVLALSVYEDIRSFHGREEVSLVKNQEDDVLYVRKILKEYDSSIYRFLLENPINHMPQLIGVYEGDNNLIIIEEYIEGKTLEEILQTKPLDEPLAIKITKDICRILTTLHNLEHPIIHRDIKPSNIIISSDGEVYLLDMNVAKWYKDEPEDTKLLGTLYYAAPEQLGYGFSASSEKSDMYAVGMLLNVMLTGKMPKEEKAQGAVWSIVEKCISMEPEKRYTAIELIEALDEL